MLLRMYMRWSERRGFKVEMIEDKPGEEAGIKSATVKVKGENAYGCCSRRAGVHRLVRISPFDSNPAAHRFASVGLARGRRRYRDRDRRRRHPHRHLSLVRRRRTARQQDRFCGADHARPDRHRRELPDRALAATRTKTIAMKMLQVAAVRHRARGAAARRPSSRNSGEKRRSTSAARSAATSCSPTRW